MLFAVKTEAFTLVLPSIVKAMTYSCTAIVSLLIEYT